MILRRRPRELAPDLGDALGDHEATLLEEDPTDLERGQLAEAKASSQASADGSASTPWPVRLLVVLLACVLHVGLILRYVILWILMPVDEKAPGDGVAPGAAGVPDAMTRPAPTRTSTPWAPRGEHHLDAGSVLDRSVSS